jgi:hypothetical protein
MCTNPLLRKQASDVATNSQATFGVAIHAISNAAGSMNAVMKKLMSSGGNSTARRSRNPSNSMLSLVKNRW